MSEQLFAIVGPRDEPGELVYWSNEDGWVDSSSATLFDHAELLTVRLPQGGSWVPMDWQPAEPKPRVRYVVAVEFAFDSDVQDSNEFAEELDGVIKGVSFAERFESDSYCVSFEITEVDR